MATKKIVQGKEMYASKAAMIKHEMKEPVEKRMKEDMAMMAKGGAVKKGAKSPAVALIIGMSKPKGKTMMNKGGMAAFEKSGKDVEKKGMKEGSKADMALDKKQMGMKKGGMVKGKK
jgi:hypothetical protein